jgi:hypothetical protein
LKHFAVAGVFKRPRNWLAFVIRERDIFEGSATEMARQFR